MKPTSVFSATIVLTMLALIPLPGQGFKGKLDKKVKSKTYKVKLKAGGQYYISMISAQFDTLVVLKDGKGKELAKDDDAGADLNALLPFTPKTNGEYQIEARSFANKGVGNYTLLVLKKTGSPKVEIGKVESKSPRYQKIKYKAYRKKLDAERGYLIELESAEIDCYLAVRKVGQAEPSASNDDAGKGTNSRLFFVPPATGDYEIWAGSYGGRPGAFTMRIQEFSAK